MSDIQASDRAIPLPSAELNLGGTSTSETQFLTASAQNGVAAGTKLITRYQYDNSKNNPANPDPNITVTWGEQSHEEMQYTALGFRWDDETVDNRKDDYQKALEASRNMGIMDTNIDGKVAKSEVRGRMATRLLAAWDQLDTNKDGFLVESELASVASIMQRSINAAQAQQSVGQ